MSAATLISSNQIFRELFETKTALDPAGNVVPMHSNIPLEYAEALYRTVLANQPSVVVEIGMAFGASSLAILTALQQAGKGGRLISIDPYQTQDWKRCGVTSVKRAGMQDQHQLFEEPDYLVLPRLLEKQFKIDFAYIDGWHTFDYTLLDFWYLDKMLNTGGVMAFNDCGWLAIDKVIGFALSHRKYSEMDVGLPKDYSERPIEEKIRDMVKKLVNRPVRRLRMKQDQYFKKVEAWEPTWNFFKQF